MKQKKRVDYKSCKCLSRTKTNSLHVDIKFVVNFFTLVPEIAPSAVKVLGSISKISDYLLTLNSFSVIIVLRVCLFGGWQLWKKLLLKVNEKVSFEKSCHPSNSFINYFFVFFCILHKFEYFFFSCCSL